MSDAIQLLEEQHAEATALFMKLERVTDPVTSAQIFRTLDSRLRDHTVIEEDIFYPAFRDRSDSQDGDSEVRDALHEHDDVKKRLQEIEQTSPTDYTFKQKISDLRALVAKHVEEEEHGILPRARRRFTQDELDELALRMTKLMSIHSPVYQINESKVQTVTRDTVHRIGDAISKITG